jgi:hypothetical protein
MEGGMDQSTDEPGGHRKPKAEPDLGYEILPEEDEPHDAEYRRRRWRDDDDREPLPRSRRTKKRRDPPAVRVLGVVAAVTAPFLALMAVVGFVYLVGGITRGRRPSKLIFGAAVWFGFLAQYYARVAWKVISGRGNEVDLRQCALCSTVVALLGGLCLPPAVMILGSGDEMPPPFVVVAIAGIVGTVLTMVTALVAWIGWQQRMSRRPR